MGDLDEVGVERAEAEGGEEWSDVDPLLDARAWRGIEGGIEEGLDEGGPFGLAELSARSLALSHLASLPSGWTDSTWEGGLAEEELGRAAGGPCVDELAGRPEDRRGLAAPYAGRVAAAFGARAARTSSVVTTRPKWASMLARVALWASSERAAVASATKRTR